jgi:hypothetical protein
VNRSASLICAIGVFDLAVDSSPSGLSAGDHGWDLHPDEQADHNQRSQLE